jgi:hypothetical protein
MQQSGLAVAGNEDALGGGLQDAATSFLDIARENASTIQDVQRARALVAQQLDAAIGAAEGKASTAELQLEQLKTQVGALVTINESVLTVAQAIQILNNRLAAQAALNQVPGGGGSQTNPGGVVSGPVRDRQERERRIRERSEQIKDRADRPLREDRETNLRLDRLQVATEANTLSTNSMSRVLKRADRGGALAVVTDIDSPLATDGFDLS